MPGAFTSTKLLEDTTRLRYDSELVACPDRFDPRGRGCVGSGIPPSLEPIMVKRYHVHLSDDDRTRLEQVLSRGKTTARVITRARILLKAAEGWHDQEIV